MTKKTEVRNNNGQLLLLFVNWSREKIRHKKKGRKQWKTTVHQELPVGDGQLQENASTDRKKHDDLTQHFRCKVTQEQEGRTLPSLGEQ